METRNECKNSSRNNNNNTSWESAQKKERNKNQQQMLICSDNWQRCWTWQRPSYNRVSATYTPSQRDRDINNDTTPQKRTACAKKWNIKCKPPSLYAIPWGMWQGKKYELKGQLTGDRPATTTTTFTRLHKWMRKNNSNMENIKSTIVIYDNSNGAAQKNPETQTATEATEDAFVLARPRQRRKTVVVIRIGWAFKWKR